jgi:DNA-binding transcriptional MerR regulator
MLTQEEMARHLGVCPQTLQRWRAFGLLKAHAYNDKNQYLYEPVADGALVKRQGQKLLERPKANLVSDLTNEVQHEA